LNVTVIKGANVTYKIPKEIGYNRISNDCVYTFGVDSRWSQSTNMLAYTNKLKMKISVIIAVL